MNLTAKDICLIIETCNAQNVERVMIHGSKLEVSFAKPIAETPLHAASNQSPVETTEIQHPIIPTEIQRDPALDNARDEIAELVISDPLAFEEMLGRGELVNGEAENALD